MDLIQKLVTVLHEPSLATGNIDCFPTIPLGWFSPWLVWRGEGRMQEPCIFGTFPAISGLNLPMDSALDRGRRKKPWQIAWEIRDITNIATGAPGNMSSIFSGVTWPPTGTTGLSQIRQAATSTE